MAKTLKSSVPVFAVFLLLILVANWEMMGVEGLKLCEKSSLTWTGDCKSDQTKHCDNQCRNWEYAQHGACHKRKGKWKCFCYFNCS